MSTNFPTFTNVKSVFCLIQESQLQHYMTDHEVNGMVNLCDQCPETFNIEVNLTFHKCMHNGAYLTCLVCQKFSRVASVKAHIIL